MSIEAYVKHGRHRGLLGTKKGAPIFPGAQILLYNIDEEKFVGAEYPDGATQAQPIEWQTKEVKEALIQQLSQPSTKPKLVVKPTLLKRPGNTRPQLKRR